MSSWYNKWVSWRSKGTKRSSWEWHTRITNRYYSKKVQARSDRLCVFAHYDEYKRIDPHVIHLLKEFHAAGCDIIFVSTCTSLIPEDREIALKYCLQMVTRDNRGYDFGSYVVGLDLMREEIAIRYRQVILCNDSVYGPFQPLKGILDAMDERDADVWGMTDSYQHKYHLQSYFLAMKSSVLSKPRVKEFWKNLPFTLDKHEVIRQCELGFTKVLKRSHLKLDCWCPYEVVQRSTIQYWKLHWKEDAWLDGVLTEEDSAAWARHALVQSCNPTHEFWNALILYHQFPFLKSELVRFNPTRQPNLISLPEVISSVSTYPFSYIRQHVQRAK